MSEPFKVVGKSGKRRSRRGLMGVLILLLMGVLFFGIYSVVTREHIEQCASGSEELKSAVDAMAQGNLDQVSVFTENITKDDSYNKEVNCLVILSEQSLLTGNSTAAESYLAQLLNIADEQQELSSDFSPLGLQTVADVEQRVEEAVKLREESYENTLLF